MCVFGYARTTFCSCDLDPMTLTYKPDPDTLKVYLYTKNEVSRSRLSKVRVRTRQTDRHCRQVWPNAVFGGDHNIVLQLKADHRQTDRHIHTQTYQLHLWVLETNPSDALLKNMHWFWHIWRPQFGSNSRRTATVGSGEY